jgi:hypothetical protein
VYRDRRSYTACKVIRSEHGYRLSPVFCLHARCGHSEFSIIKILPLGKLIDNVRILLL